MGGILIFPSRGTHAEPQVLPYGAWLTVARLSRTPAFADAHRAELIPHPQGGHWKRGTLARRHPSRGGGCQSWRCLWRLRQRHADLHRLLGRGWQLGKFARRQEGAVWASGHPCCASLLESHRRGDTAGGLRRNQRADADLFGTRSPAPSRAITRLLAETLPRVRHRTIRDHRSGGPRVVPKEDPPQRW